MKTLPTDDKDVMFMVEYGSRLYGTSTPSSDTDYKVLYLPNIDDVLLGKRMVSTKARYDANGVKITDDTMSMPADGVEAEFIPFQTFVRDFVQGQTYAVECAFAIKNQGPTAPSALEQREYDLVLELITRFSNAEVYSMVSFAQKQTFDYVKRGERLNEALKVQKALRDVIVMFGNTTAMPRLDTKFMYGNFDFVLDWVAKETGLKTGVSVNSNKSQRTLELNGRSYLESTRIDHILQQVNKLVEKYGERTNEAAKKEVDWKSMSHAVRVYQQSLELLATGKITFPRPNAADLLKIKQGQLDFETVKSVLNELDEEVLVAMAASTVQKKTPALVAQSEQWLLAALRELYDLQ